jgi:site-specific DNA recombinase
MSTPIRAVAYYRMSTSSQEGSIPEQKEWARRACEKADVQIVREFEDPGIAGSEIDHRPGFVALLDFCEERARKKSPVEAVVVWDADRFSRADSIRTAACISRLLDAGVSRMLSAEGWTDWGNDIDRVFYNLKQDLTKASFSKNMSRNVTRAMIARALEGAWVGGPIPYAYIVGDDGKLALGDPVRVEAVRWMFRTYCDTPASLADIAYQLNAQGIPAPRGGLWTRVAVRRILLNAKYLGDMHWNESHRGKFHRVNNGQVAKASDRTRTRRQRNLRHNPAEPNPPEHHIVVTDAHPPIVDAKTFARVAEKLRGHRRTTPVPGGGDWLLTGLLFCGHCGYRMWGRVETPKSGNGKKVYVYRRYVCGGNRTHGRGFCRTNRASQDAILTEVVALIRSNFCDPDSLAKLRTEIVKLAAEKEEELTACKQRLQDHVAELDRQIEKGTERLLLVPKDLIEKATAKLRAWQDQRAQANAELARIDAVADAGAELGSRVEEAIGLLERLEEVIHEGDPNEIRSALGGMVKKIILHFDYNDEAAGSVKQAELAGVEVELQSQLVNLLQTASLLSFRRKCDDGNQGGLHASKDMEDFPLSPSSFGVEAEKQRRL